MLRQLRVLMKSLFVRTTTILPTSASSETIINKDDADRIFSMIKPQWEVYVANVRPPPGWEGSIVRYETGSSLMTFDITNGTGMTIQPLYPDEESLPDSLIVSSYYPLGFFPPFTEELRRQIEEVALIDLGIEYSVSASYKEVPPGEIVVLEVSKASRQHEVGE